MVIATGHEGGGYKRHMRPAIDELGAALAAFDPADGGQWTTGHEYALARERDGLATSGASKDRASIEQITGRRPDEYVARRQVLYGPWVPADGGTD